MTHLHKLAWIGLAGGLGALSRYGLALAVQRMVGAGFPLGTFVVNIVGCFGFGLIFGLFEQRVALGSELRMILLTGFMGAFTTFSTYMFESLHLLRQGQYLSATANVGGQILLGLLAVSLGLALAQRL